MRRTPRRSRRTARRCSTGHPSPVRSSRPHSGSSLLQSPPPSAPAQEVQSRRGPSDQQQQTQGDDPAEQARKQAWQTYYQQLAALQQQRQQDALGAMKAETASNGTGMGGSSGQQPGTLAPDSQVGGSAGRASHAGRLCGRRRLCAWWPGARQFRLPGPPACRTRSVRRAGKAGLRQPGRQSRPERHARCHGARSDLPLPRHGGDVIPCVAQGGEDSDTPGQFVGRVSATSMTAPRAASC